MGVCCRIGLCCPPVKQAAELAAGYGVPLDGLAALLADFRLVPLALEPAAGAPRPQAGHEMLARLNRHAQSELAMILTALGHPTTDEGSAS